MTKLRSKKMTKSTFAIIIMAIVMVACLAFGGTYAYFTAESKKAATDGLVTGVIEIKLGAGTAITLAGNNAVPGQKFLNNASITLDDGDSTAAFYAFAKVSATATVGGKAVELFYTTEENPTDLTKDNENFKSAVEITLTDTNGETEGNGQSWEAQADANVYGITSAKLTAASGVIALDGKLADGIVAHHAEGDSSITETNNVYYYDVDTSKYVKLPADTDFEGLAIDVTVSFYAIQSEVVGEMAAAYDLVKAEL